MDFKESGFMYAVAAFVIGFVVVESVFFIVKAWRRGRELGLTRETLKNTVLSSITFTIAPAFSILATVFALASALGIVLPWIRLSVIGNLAYEKVASDTMLGAMGAQLNAPVTDPAQFGAVAWVMTLGTSFALLLLPFLCKRIHKKIGSVVNKSVKNTKLADVVSTAAFIGIIAAFIARAVYGKTKEGVGDAGFMSIATLLTAVVVSLLLEALCNRLKWKTFSNFVMPISMFAAMGVAVLLNWYLPAAVSQWTWWNRV